MEMDNEKLFRDAPVWKVIAFMASTSVIAILAITLYDIADMYFLGRLNDANQIAAVSIVSPVFSLAMAVAMMLGNGASTLIARAVGAKDTKGARTYAAMCFHVCVSLGLTISVLIVVFRKPLLRLLGAEEVIFGAAEQYMVIRAVGITFILLSTALSSIATAEGCVLEGLAGNLVSTAVNLVLDPIFILALGMGISGAAIATVAGNVAGFVFYLVFIKRKANIANMHISYAIEKPGSVLPMIALGFPSAIASLLSGLAMGFGNRMLVSFGTDAVAAFAAADRASFVIGVLQMAICMGLQPFFAYTLGANNVARTKEAIRKLAMLTASIGVLSTAACLLLRRQLIALFLTQPEVADLGVPMAVFLISGLPFVGFYYMATTLLQASGDAKRATFMAVLRQGLILIPVLFLGKALLGVMGVAAGYMVTDLLSTVIGIVVLIRKKM